MRKVFSHGIVLTMALMCCLLSPAIFSQKRWTGNAGDGLWTSAANWSGGTGPVSTDDVVLDHTTVAGSYTITLPGNATVQTIRSLQIGYAGNINSIRLLIDNTTGGVASVLTLNGGGASALHIHENGILENSSSYASSSQVIRLVNASDVFKMSSNAVYIHNNNANIPRRSSGTTSANYDFATTSVFELKTSTFDANPVYGCLTYNISGTNSAARNLTINGDLSVLQGTFGVAASTSNTFTIGGNVSISAGAVLRGSSSTGTSTITVTGNITGTGTLQGSSNINGTTNITVGGDITSFVNFGTGVNTISFSGGNADASFTPANISTPAVQNVIIGDGINSKTITLGSSIAITSLKTLTVTNASTLKCGAKKISGSGSVTINDGGIIQLGSTSASGAVADNMAVSGNVIFNPGSTIELNGLSAQVINTNSFSNLKINNVAGVALSGDVSVSGTLTLSAGNFSVSNNTLTLTGTAIAGTASNLSTTSASSLTFGGNASGVVIPSAVTAINNLTLNNPNGVSLNSNLVVNGTTTLTAGNLLIGSNTLTLNGTIVSTGGAFDGTSNSNLVLGGSSAQLITFAANAALKDLTLSKTNGACTLGSTLNLYGAIEWTNVNGMLDLAGQNLVLKSTAAGTSRIGEVPPSKLVNATNVTVERYIPARRSWRLLTAPLIGALNNSVFYNWQNNGTATGGGFEMWAPVGTGSLGNGLTMGPGSSLRKYNSAGWVNVTDTKSETLFNASGNNSFAVFVTAPYGSGNISSGFAATTARATGSLRTGDIVYSNLVANKHSLIGNPYASPVNIHDVMTVGTNIDPYVWLWDPYIGTVGGYVTYDVVADSYTTSSSYPADVQSGHAFFIRANNSINTLTFLEQHKTNGATNSVYRRNTDAAIFKIALYKTTAPGEVLCDAVMSVYAPGANNSVDNNDAIKLNNSGENIAIARNGTSLSVEHRAIITSPDTLFFIITNTSQGNYKFLFNGINMPTGVTAFLSDRFLNTFQPINLTGISSPVNFSVTADPLSSGNRFTVVFKAPVVLPIQSIELKAVERGTAIILNWNASDESNTAYYEVERSMNGTVFSPTSKLPRVNKNYEWIDYHPLVGVNYYRIKSVGVRGENFYSTIATVRKNNTVSIDVYPNPAKAFLWIRLNNMPLGDYRLSLINSTGQAVLTRMITHNNPVARVTIKLEKNLPPGIYLLRLSRAGMPQYQQTIAINP